MSKAIALSKTAYSKAIATQVETLRMIIVLGCGASLIFAGQASPL